KQYDIGSHFVFLNDGTTLATVEVQFPSASVIRFWDVKTGKETRQIQGPKGDYILQALASSPDGKTLAWAGRKGRVFLYDANSGNQLSHFDLPRLSSSYVSVLAFSPNGKLLAAKEAYRPTTYIWDLESGKARSRLGDVTNPWGENATAGIVCNAPAGPLDCAF